MKPLTEREIKDLLTEHDVPTPPAGLAERIKREIPAEIVFEDAAFDETEPTDTGGSVPQQMSRSRFWLMAASLVLALGGGFLALRWMDQVAPLSEALRSTEASAPQADEAVEVVAEAKPEAPTLLQEAESSADRLVLADQFTPSGELAPSQEMALDPEAKTLPEASGESLVGESSVALEQPSEAMGSSPQAPAAPRAEAVRQPSRLRESASRLREPTSESKRQEAADTEVQWPWRTGQDTMPAGRVPAGSAPEPAPQARQPLESTPSPAPEVRSRASRGLVETARPAPETSMMQGTITDEQGAGLPGVMVTATSPELQGERSTHTGAEGRYKLRALPPGEYKVAYELEGFATEIESNEVSAGETLESNVEMQLAEVVEDIVVTSNVDTISESTAAVSIHRDEMKKLSVERQLADSAEAPRAQSLTLTGAARAYPRSDVPKPQLAPSTGGTTEPNDAPYGDVFFESAGTNPFIDTEDDALSTFGLDVDSGSYTVARRYLLDGHLPQPESVRVEEFVNYFDYGDAAPEEAEFAIHAEGAPSIFGEGDRYYLLRFNLSGRELDEADRKPALLTFVVDVSGSMARENRLGLVQQALSLLLDQLRPDDRIALVTYGTTGQVVFEPTADREAIRRAIQGLRTGGSTNAEHGLSLAYELAARHARRGMLNRVILCSDGVANVGGTSADTILDRIRRDADQGVELTTVGFGMGNYNDILMERLADEGNGRYAYVDTLDEARRIFVENLTGTLQTLAADARVQVEFDPRVVTRYRLLGYENRDLADERFRDDTADAGEIGVGHSVTALYEIKLRRPPRPRDEIGTLRLRYGSTSKGEIVELERTVTGADFVKRWENGSTALRLTSLVAEFAEILKHSYWAKEGDLDDVFRRVQKVSAELPGNHDTAELVNLVSRASRAWARRSDR